MATRTVPAILRDMAQIKAQVKDVAIRDVLLKPLEDELKCYVESVTRQGKLDLPKK